MTSFSYSKGIVNKYGLHELSEVTFALSSHVLRRIAAFLNSCADDIKAGVWRTDHRHLIDCDPQWDKDHPRSDVIVIHASAGPPKVVA